MGKKGLNIQNRALNILRGCICTLRIPPDTPLNIPLEGTINICTNLLYKNENVIVGINKSEFQNLYCFESMLLATQRLYFIFNDVLYKQKDDMAVELSLGPILFALQMFSCHFMM